MADDGSHRNSTRHKKNQRTQTPARNDHREGLGLLAAALGPLLPIDNLEPYRYSLFVVATKQQIASPAT